MRYILNTLVDHVRERRHEHVGLLGRDPCVLEPLHKRIRVKVCIPHCT